jgi:hypothetical protein
MRLKPRDGDWVGVPLERGGWALGRLAKVAASGIAVGYFFDRRWYAIPERGELESMDPTHVMSIRQFGFPAKDNEEGWFIIPRAEGAWDEDSWPVPDFWRLPPFFREGWGIRVTYDYDLSMGPEFPAPLEELLGLPEDGLDGPVYLALTLDKRLPPPDPNQVRERVAAPTSGPPAGDLPEHSPPLSLTSTEALAAEGQEHCVIVTIPLSDAAFGTEEDSLLLDGLEDQIATAFMDAGAGEYDGHEIGLASCDFYCYGPDAEELARTLRSALAGSQLPAGSALVLRFGPATSQSAEERREPFP